MTTTTTKLFKEAYPDMPENYPLRSVLMTYFEQGLEMGLKEGLTKQRRKWIERAHEREAKPFTIGPLKVFG